MGLYALTGGATGIGAELRTQLEARGDEVITVDIKAGEVVADLSSVQGRRAAIDALGRLAPDGLDGFVPCAGLSPAAKPITQIARVNYFAVVDTVEGLRELLAKKRGSVLIVSSNSAPLIDTADPFVQACLDGNEEAACAALEGRDGQTAYAGAKRAVAIWMRRNVVDYAAQGIRMNAIAPGITMTPMTQEVYADKQYGDAIRAFGDSVPLGASAEPRQIANVMRFLLSPEADFVCGSVFFADGGSDAMLRPESF
ncbi:MAG: SDR family oxidoreductase [Halioglobus sp.]|nr:SDR family oxidoreductase [Halioglobus sp.]